MRESAKRLRKEFADITRDPPPNIVAKPNMSNILEWHYVIFGPKGSVYEGGVYHGRIKFPPEYPHKPPSIMMITPSGRFQTNTRLCLSMSDFHPETWNPMWTVSSILTGLLSFMLENKETHGSIMTSDSQKRKFATYSKIFNAKNPVFRQHYSELVDKTLETSSMSEPVLEPTPTTAPPPQVQLAPQTQNSPNKNATQQLKDVRYNLLMIVIVLIMFISFINLWF